MRDLGLQARGMAIAVALAAFMTAGTALADEAAWGDLAGWQVAKTPHSYATLVERLDQAVEDNDMGVVTRASATLGAKKMLNQEIPGNMVVGVYHPRFAVRMLEASIPAGIEAPIRFYITENPDKTATLSYKTPSALFAPYADGGEALKQLAAELDAIFAAITAQAVGQ
ncbi:MAG: DUF302 domain-containing protein [Kiloniellales bacterium]